MDASSFERKLEIWKWGLIENFIVQNNIHLCTKLLLQQHLVSRSAWASLTLMTLSTFPLLATNTPSISASSASLGVLSRIINQKMKKTKGNIETKHESYLDHMLSVIEVAQWFHDLLTLPQKFFKHKSANVPSSCWKLTCGQPPPPATSASWPSSWPLDQVSSNYLAASEPQYPSCNSEVQSERRLKVDPWKPTNGTHTCLAGKFISLCIHGQEYCIPHINSSGGDWWRKSCLSYERAKPEASTVCCATSYSWETQPTVLCCTCTHPTTDLEGNLVESPTVLALTQNTIPVWNLTSFYIITK